MTGGICDRDVVVVYNIYFSGVGDHEF